MKIHRSMRHLTAAAAAGAMVLAAASAPAAASGHDTNVTISGGLLAITEPTVGDFTGVTLDGTAQTTTATFADFTVTDPRGTGAGWNVTVQASQFAEWDTGGGAYVASGRTLAQNSLSMAAPTVAGNGTTSAVPAITGGPYTLDGGTAVKVASAAVDTGMGTFDFTQPAAPLTLSVPASVYAATYRSTVTVSVVTGP
jgi:hypothetical protein